MPFKSQAQEGFAHEHPEKFGGKAGLAEWDAATKGKSLPEHVGDSHMSHSAAAQGLKAHASKKIKPKHLKEFHAKEQNDGGYHVKRHSGKPNEAAIEHHALDLEAVHSALEDHMGQPAEPDAQGGGAPAPDAGGGAGAPPEGQE